jgi:PAS domain S-box-containing protein
MAAVYADQLRTLRETQARLRALIENEPECVKVLDREGRLLEMNAAGLRMIEADAAVQVVGHCVYGLVAPEHAAAFRALTERVCGGERGTLEFEIIGLQGTRRWLETHAVPFRDEETGETRLLAITRDITARRHAERALRESEQRFQMFLDHLPATAWIRDRNFRYTYVNQRYAQTWGVEGEDLLGRDAAELFPGPVAEHFRETDERVARDGVPLEYVDALPSGRWLKMKFPVPDGRGGIGVAGIALDITERSRLEAALRESEQRFRLFMQHAPAAAWIKDANFRYSYVNRSYEAVHGRAASAVLGRDDFELHDAARAHAFREEDERIRRSGQAEQKMHAVPYADGRPGHWLVVKFPLEDGVGGIGIDVTPRLEAEEKARRYAEEVRTLANRLVQAQEAERRRIAGGLHDLIGQNLTALGIDLQALKQRLQGGGDMISGPRIDAMAALVETTIDAIRDVMTDLHPPALEEFGLVPALRWHAAQFGNRTGMKVVTRVHGNERRLEADTELALFRIVQEAFTNAAKHSGGSAIQVRIDYAEGVRLTVADNGRGFAEREGARAARRGGFGLPTMRERAEAVGGRLRIEFPEQGTRLVVEVP